MRRPGGDVPLVSVGIPVYNGENYLARALDSLVTSDYPNLEVVVSDNASTDRTRAIVTDYAGRLRRLRYYRNPTNVGAAANYNTVLRLSTGTYFRWLAHDDWCSTDYDTRCVSRLLAEPGVVLVFAGQTVVDEYGRARLTNHQVMPGTMSQSPARRVASLAWRLQDPTAPVFGLMVRETLLRTKGIRATPEPDRLLVHEMALYGKIADLDAPLFFHFRGRGHSLHYGEHAVARRRSFEWLSDANKGKRQLTTARVMREHLVAIANAHLSPAQSALCAAQILTASSVRRPVGKVRQARKRRAALRRAAAGHLYDESSAPPANGTAMPRR